MEYRSSKDMSTIWGITSKRINVLAKEGRIKGAKLIGNTWMIPFDAIKPSDKRFKVNKEQNIYLRFPLLSFQTYNNENFYYTLTNEEKRLLKAEKLFLANRMNDSLPLFLKLLSSKYKYIKIGALYYVCFTYLLSKQFEEYDKYYQIFSNEIDSFNNTHEELILLKEKLRLLVKGNINFTFDSEVIRKLEYKRGTYTFVTVFLFYNNVIDLLRGNGNKDIKIYEFVANSFNIDDSPYVANELHTYIALMYRILGNKDEMEKHLKIAINIAYKYKVYNILSESRNYVKHSFDKILLDYPESLKTIFDEGNKLYVEATNSIAMYYNGKDIPTLKETDYRYIMYAINNSSNKIIAIENNITEAAVSKKYQTLYDKFKVSSKEELALKFVSSISNPYLIID